MYAAAADYGMMAKAEYMQHANETTLLCLMIEGKDGLSNLDEILSVLGIDIIFAGPYDLSQSLGLPGQVLHPQVQGHIKDMLNRVRAKGLAFGLFVDTVETARDYRDMGVQFISISVDVHILRLAAQGMTSALKG
ncbi:MAG: 2-keto-3-deoxy-L-rhamnonate aldolase [Nitrosomonadaceae bacterium]|nr:2-keto-3-deoxy-L-rhamnonate aldolase [Nitrosomonadaceae bacterium]